MPISYSNTQEIDFANETGKRLTHQAWARKVTAISLLVSAVALLFLVATSPHRLIYDEGFYQKYVALLDQYGTTVAFLKAIPSPAGPLYAYVQAAFRPITHLEPRAIRFVNLILLALVALLLRSSLRGQNISDAGLVSASVLSVPMTWVIAGMALTEMPAMFFVTASMTLVIRALQGLEQRLNTFILLSLAAVCLAISVWGRQPYVVLAPVPMLIAVFEPRLRWPSVVFATLTTAGVAPLFLIWGGLLPPALKTSVQGASVQNGLLSFAYTGICFLLLAPRFFRSRITLIGSCVLAAIAVNTIWPTTPYYPMHSVANRFLSHSVEALYGVICASALSAFGLLFLVLLLKACWTERGKLTQLSAHLSLLACTVTPFLIAHQFSSRYSAAALPFLVMSSLPYRRWTPVAATLTIVGASVGFISLQSYFH